LRDLSGDHLLASAKACDALLAMKVPPSAGKLRRILNLAQLIQSHALSFFLFVLAGLSDRDGRRTQGAQSVRVMRKHPELGRGGIRMRQSGSSD